MSLALGPIRFAPAAPLGRVTLALCVLFALVLSAHAQQPQPETPQQPAPSTATPAPAQTPAPAPDATQDPSASSPAPAAAQTEAAQAPAPTPATQQPAAPAATPAAQPIPKAGPSQSGSITEDELKQMLVGKQLYLRGGYLGDAITFDEHGRIIGHSPKGSYTLSVIQVDHVRLTKHKVELEGIRYGLHFNEQLAYEDSSTAFDKVRITPKKKVVKLTIDREMVVSPKKKKEPPKEKTKAAKPAPVQAQATAPAVASGSAPSTAPAAASSSAAPSPAAPPPTDAGTSATPAPAPGAEASSTPASPPASDPGELSEADQLKASIAATPEAERPADPSSVTTTTSQAHANSLLRDALDAIFAPGLDDRMMAAMPDFWKFYYQAVAAKADYRPADPSILRQNTVDQKAQLLTSFEPDSNDFAQAAGVAGMALYHTVIGSDGKASEIAVARPIGFGLDENAVAAIRKAKFSPAIKGGQPVPVMLDLVVQFRIFSKRTAVASTPDPADKDKPAEPKLPGPYSVPHPAPQPQPTN